MSLSASANRLTRVKFLIVGTCLEPQAPRMRGRDPSKPNARQPGVASDGGTSPPFPLIGDPAHISALPFALSNARVVTGAEAWRSQMTAIARGLSRAFVNAAGVGVFKQLVLFCTAGLFVSLLLLTYGLDLSPGFF